MGGSCAHTDDRGGIHGSVGDIVGGVESARVICFGGRGDGLC